MKGLSAVLFCITLAVGLVACGQDKGKTTQVQSRAPTQAKKTQAQKKTPAKSQKKAPTVAQKKQQDRSAECNTQANLKNMKGEERRRFVNSCLGGRA
jgi:psiF repeat-containing protein